MSVYANLAHKRQTKKDKVSREKAEYLASLPKHPVKRFFYRLHPKRVFKYWFSKRGGLMALKILGVSVVVMVLLVGGLFAYFRKDLDKIRPGEIAKRVQTTVTKYYDRNDVLLWEDKGGGNYKLVVEADQLSDYLKKATVSIEDKDFYTHHGISISGIARATFSTASGSQVQGGSTLTQQLVKQVFFPPEEANKRGLDGIPRKIKEIILAIEVERMYNKDKFSPFISTSHPTAVLATAQNLAPKPISANQPKISRSLKQHCSPRFHKIRATTTRTMKRDTRHSSTVSTPYLTIW